MNKHPKGVFLASETKIEGLYSAQYSSIEVEDWVGRLDKGIASKLLKALKEGRLNEELKVLRASYRVRTFTENQTEEMPLHLKFASVILSEKGVDAYANEKEFLGSTPVSMKVKKVTVIVKKKIFSRV